jgi:hypothetical protein
MRFITINFKNGYAFVTSECHIPGLGQTYTCHHCSVSRSSLHRILSLYPKYDVDTGTAGSEIVIQIRDREYRFWNLNGGK